MLTKRFLPLLTHTKKKTPSLPRSAPKAYIHGRERDATVIEIEGYNLRGKIYVKLPPLPELPSSRVVELSLTPDAHQKDFSHSLHLFFCLTSSFTSFRFMSPCLLKIQRILIPCEILFLHECEKAHGAFRTSQSLSQNTSTKS